jgi:hypothetical protein
MDGDGRVLVGDILYAVQKFMTNDALADLDESGLVTVADILRAVGQYASFCTR